jgi:hypothetical protein
MGYGIIVLMGLGSIMALGAIFTGVWIAACLYQANKLEKRLKCTCGRRSFLHFKEADDKTPKQLVYMCQCGAKGYIGYDKEEALFGWELRGNHDAYLKYIVTKHERK